MKEKKYFNKQELKALYFEIITKDKYKIEIKPQKEKNKNRYTIHIGVYNLIKNKFQNFEIIENWNLTPKNLTQRIGELFMNVMRKENYIPERYPDIKEFLND